MKNINIVIWGFGAMGRGMADMLLSKKGVEITGVCDLHPDLVGKSIFKALESDQGNHPEACEEEVGRERAAARRVERPPAACPRRTRAWHPC